MLKMNVGKGVSWWELEKPLLSSYTDSSWLVISLINTVNMSNLISDLIDCFFDSFLIPVDSLKLTVYHC